MAAGNPNVRFVVEPVDVDGDNIPDGDLVKKLQKKADGSWQVVSQRFVAAAKMEQIATQALGATGGPREQVVYQRNPANEENKPVIIKDETSFGQHVKAGAGVTLGANVVQGVFDGLAALFNPSEGAGGGRRK